MGKIKDFLRDCLLSLTIGLLIGIVLAALFAAIGALVNGLQGALEASRSVVFLVGGLLMLYSALLMLKGGNLPPDAFSLHPWKKERTQDFDDVEPLKVFHMLPRQFSYLLMAFGILTVSVLPESIVLYYL